MEKPILVIGAINVDLVVNTPKIPVMGETVIGSGFMRTAGGKAANQAVAAARMGGSVILAGAVGNDVFADEMLCQFRKDGIITDYILTHPSLPTGTATIVLHKGDNFIIIDPGANGSISVEQIRGLTGVIKNSAMILLQMEIPLPACWEAVKIATSCNVPVLLNPAPALEIPDEILKQIDVLVPNEHECEILTGVRIVNETSAEKAILILLERCVKQVIITMGEKGAVYNDGTTMRSQKAFVPEKVVDTTAAGDAFLGTLAVWLSLGKNIAEAVEFASRTASVVVSRHGAQPSIPYLSEIICGL